MKTTQLFQNIIAWLKKYGWIILLILLVAMTISFFWGSKSKVQVQDNTVLVHKFDSSLYIHSNDSLKGVIRTLEQELAKREVSYAQTIKILSKKTDAVQTLPITEVAEAFSERIYVDVGLEARGDTVAILPMQGIRNALVIIYRGDEALVGLSYYKGQDSLKTVLIDNQKQLMNIKDTRIVALTSEFYKSQAVITGLNADIEKAQRKLRNRNKVLGIISGAAAVAVLVAVLR